MKYISWPVIAVLVLFLNLDFAAGQLVDRHGLKLGISMNTVTGPDVGALKDKQIIAGITGGGFVTVKLHRKLSLQAEFLVSQKGYTRMIDWAFSLPRTEIVACTRITYFDIPLLLSYHPLPFLDMYAGLYWGMCINGRTWYEFDSDINTLKLQYLGMTDAGYVAGIVVSASNLLLDIRYNLGNKPLLDSGLDFRNQQLILLAGWQY